VNEEERVLWCCMTTELGYLNASKTAYSHATVSYLLTYLVHFYAGNHGSRRKVHVPLDTSQNKFGDNLSSLTGEKRQRKGVAHSVHGQTCLSRYCVPLTMCVIPKSFCNEVNAPI